MTSGEAPSLRVALLLRRFEVPGGEETERSVSQLAVGLRERGISPEIIRPDPGPLAMADTVLRRRGFTSQLAAVPSALGALLAGGYHLAHSFSATDAAAALAWRRMTRRPVVHTCVEPVERATLADGRLRLTTLRRSVKDTDAVLAPSSETQGALRRWLLVDAAIVAPDDYDSHEALYRRLMEAGGGL